MIDLNFFEKAKKGSPVGTEKTWGGKIYIKTEKGWKPKGKRGKKATEKESLKQSPTDKIAEQAALATDEQLKAVIKDPEADSELKNSSGRIEEKRC